MTNYDTRRETTTIVIDLCARLPYGVKVQIKSTYTDDEYITVFNSDLMYLIGVKSVKPYLHPMSSMTEEEEKEFEELFIGYSISRDRNCVYHSTRGDLNIGIIDWFNKKGFDYRGLIPMGLALEAPKGMY